MYASQSKRPLGQGSRDLCVRQESREPVTSQAQTVSLPALGHTRFEGQSGPPAYVWGLERLCKPTFHIHVSSAFISWEHFPCF